MKETILMLSCEHASNHLPAQWQHLLASLDITTELLESFAAYDPFAKELTLYLAQNIQCDFLLGQISRLIIDLNKSTKKEKCLPKHISQNITTAEKQLLLNQEYHHYHQQFEQLMAPYLLNNQQILHLSVHTFKPMHNAAIGILYDTKRHAEKEVARIFYEILTKRTNFKVRLNYPRTGAHDNYNSVIRKQLSEDKYLGIELECNVSLMKDVEQAAIFQQNLCLCINSLLELL